MHHRIIILLITMPVMIHCSEQNITKDMGPAFSELNDIRASYSMLAIQARLRIAVVDPAIHFNEQRSMLEQKLDYLRSLEKKIAPLLGQLPHASEDMIAKYSALKRELLKNIESVRDSHINALYCYTRRLYKEEDQDSDEESNLALEENNYYNLSFLETRYILNLHVQSLDRTHALIRGWTMIERLNPAIDFKKG